MLYKFLVVHIDASGVFKDFRLGPGGCSRCCFRKLQESLKWLNGTLISFYWSWSLFQWFHLFLVIGLLDDEDPGALEKISRLEEVKELLGMLYV